MQHEYNEADLIEQDKQAEQNRLDAERYGKLKAVHADYWMRWVELAEQANLNAAVDALPDGGKQ